MNKLIIGNQVFSQSRSQYKQAWLFAIIWNAFTWFAIIKADDNILKAFTANPIFYFFVTFPFIGLWLVIYAIKETKAWYKFGKTPVTLDPFPGQIGGRCAGHLTLPIAKNNTEQAIFTLNCIHRYSKRDSQGKSSWREDILWQDRASFKPDQYGKFIRINFLFNTPQDLPASEQKSDDYHFWLLHVRIALPGIDYDRVFNIPMEIADAHQLAATDRFQPKISRRIAHQDTDVSNMPKIKKTTAGLQLYYGYGRSKGMALGIFIFGCLLAVFDYFFFDGFLDFLPVTSGLMMGFVGFIAFGLCFFGLLMVANSLMIEVSSLGIRKKQRIFSFLFEEFTDASDIADIVVDQNASSGHGNRKRVWYRLKLINAVGQEMEVGDSLEGQSYAKEIRQKMIDALGRNWQAATAIPQKRKIKKPLPLWLRIIGKILSYSLVLALLYDLGMKIPHFSDFLDRFFYQ